jgi:small subunit ribosomal protein S20
VAKRTASAKKQARAGVKRALRNRAVRSEVKTLVVKARRSLSGAPVAETDRYALTLDAVRALDRAAAKGVLHPNNAARRKARLARQMAKLAVAPPAAVGKGGKKPAAPARAAVSSKPASSKKK